MKQEQQLVSCSRVDLFLSERACHPNAGSYLLQIQGALVAFHEVGVELNTLGSWQHFFEIVVTSSTSS
jgi:hypothetical protein